MYLRGNATGLSWELGIEMTHISGDTWSAKFSAQQGAIEFKALINDKTWALGANGQVDLSTNTNVNYFPWFKRTSGRYEYVRQVPSPQFKNTRDLVVYLPPSYDENTLKVYQELLIMQDGENVFNSSTAFGGNSWEAQPTIDALILSGKIGELIVVAVDNDQYRIDEYTYSVDATYGGGKADEYIAFLQQQVSVYQLQISSQRQVNIAQDVVLYILYMGNTI
jgi:hypothetical protein